MGGGSSPAPAPHLAHLWPRAQQELAAFAPFQSKDIDFLGDRHAAEALA